MVEFTRAQRIEQTIRTYNQACNDADAEAIAACFCPDAVHYFPHIPKWSARPRSEFRKCVHMWPRRRSGYPN